MNPSNIPKKLVGSEEERAVSPVIGVILMVAITVILAAVIAAFVMDIGPGGDPAPSTNFDVDGANSDVGTDDDIVEFTIQSGENIDSELLSINVDSDNEIDEGDAYSVSGTDDGTIASGDSITVANADPDSEVDLVDGDTITLVWSDGDSTTTLATWEVTETITIENT